MSIHVVYGLFIIILLYSALFKINSLRDQLKIYRVEKEKLDNSYAHLTKQYLESEKSKKEPTPSLELSTFIKEQLNKNESIVKISLLNSDDLFLVSPRDQ